MIISQLKDGVVTAVLVTISVSVSVPAFAHDPASHTHETASGAVGDEPPFLTENDAAMEKMMSAMAVRPTGDIDRDFVKIMAPHHQGALDMAQASLRYGKNEQLKRISQEIIVEQLQEIAAMRMALGDPIRPSAAVPTLVGANSTSVTHHSEP